MAYSYSTYPNVTAGQVLTVGFPFRRDKRDEEVVVSVDGLVVGKSLYEWYGDTQIRTKTGFPAGASTKIYRRTGISAYEFSQDGSSSLDWEGMNLNFTQALYAIQEYADGYEDREILIGELRDTVGEALSSVTLLEDAAQAASQAAASAAQSAATAASWNPSSYYTKTEINAQMGGKASLSGSLFEGWASSRTGFGLISNYGTNELVPGTGDNATFESHNMALRGWYGLGMVNRTTGAATGVYNFREGTWNVKGGYYVNGAPVWHSGNLTPFDANGDNAGRALHIFNNDGVNAIFSRATGSWGNCLRLETRGDGSQEGPQLNFTKANKCSWSVGIEHWNFEGGADFVWFLNGNNVLEGDRHMKLAAGGGLWTKAYGWLHDHFETKGAKELGAVGSYAVLRTIDNFIPSDGQQVSGANLRFINGGAPGGVWLCVGIIQYVDVSALCLFVRLY